MTEHEVTLENQDGNARARDVIWRFAQGGATAGFIVGLLEAGLFYYIPRASGLLRPDVEYVIWFLAPGVDFLAGAVVGLVLGGLCSLARKSLLTLPFGAALGFGLMGAYGAWLLDWFRIGIGTVFPRQLEPSTPVEFFLIVFIAALALFVLFRSQAERFFGPFHRAGWLAVDGAVLAILILGVAVYATHRPFAGGRMKRPVEDESYSSHYTYVSQLSHPNIVLIVLDTVRADHLSCYGYSRPTTPRLSQLAARGVLFENAISPSSWTLPSITSILTGLMPHQTGADWNRPPGSAPWPLARILRSKGYETAGFNANPYYGLGGWRLDEGFDVYEDDRVSIRHNLAVTFMGQSVLRSLYDHLIRYNQFDRRSARDVNRDIKRWMDRRSPAAPYFLFINYMDAHRPYLPPAPFGHRFGRIPSALLSRLSLPLKSGHPPKPYTPQEREELKGGYNNSLAYLDLEVGRLIDFLRRRPGGNQTIFIVTSDHGEGFGEHGTYDHGWNLYREVLHVPLIVSGAGIPHGVRVSGVVSNRRIFSTVLDLALGLKGAVEQSSLSRWWMPAVEPHAQSHGALSELDILNQGADPASISLTTSEWQLILDSGGQTELYDIRKDPGEKANLASDPGESSTVAKLRAALEARVATSLLPWRATAYLSPLDQPGATFIQQITSQPQRLPAARVPIGSTQAIFSRQPPTQLIHAPRSQKEILRSLPYH